MKNAKTLLFFLFGGLIIGGMFMLAMALTIEEFTDGTSEGNLTFTEVGSLYKNISIKEIGFIKNATIDLRGDVFVSDYCYQEDFETAADCGGFNNGSFTWYIGGSNFGNMHDGNWDNFGGFGSNAYGDFEYEIPRNVTSAVWQVKQSQSLQNTFNFTIPTNCTNTNRLKLRVRTTAFNNFTYQCFTGSDWYNMLNTTTGGFTDIYEEAIWWYLSGYPTNISISLNNTLIYQNLSNTIGNFNGSTTINFADELNTQRVACEFTDGTNCNISINFTSYSVGILEYSNINITQNEVPNATNVSITTLPITAGSDLKGHVNFSDPDNDVFTKNETYWYINGSVLNSNNNSPTLGGENVTELANITFSARVNDSYDWGDWVNSSTATVGDSTPPVIINISTQNKTSFTTDDKINITAIVTDAIGIVQSVKVTTNKSDVHTNHTMNLIGNNIYQFADTFAVGNYNIPYVYAKDGSNNEKQQTSGVSFSVSSPVAPPPAGGGGGALPCPAGFARNATGACINITAIEILVGQCNFNGICEPRLGEDFLNCGINIGGDCEFTVSQINPACLGDPNIPCIYRTSLFVRLTFILAGFSGAFLLISNTRTGRKARRWLKENININLLKEKF